MTTEEAFIVEDYKERGKELDMEIAALERKIAEKTDLPEEPKKV